jgi:hypothetical protein
LQVHQYLAAFRKFLEDSLGLWILVSLKVYAEFKQLVCRLQLSAFSLFSCDHISEAKDVSGKMNFAVNDKVGILLIG